MAQPTNFDRLTRLYLVLERVAFGRDLERARFCYLDRLQSCRSILVLGEGDGRCLARLVKVAPTARIHCIDFSPRMVAAAERRLTDPASRARVTLTCADIFAVPLPPDAYDAVTTFFFLDCFTDAQVEKITRQVSPSLGPSALWLFADFVLPPRGWRRLRARLWIALLYAFFRWQTGLKTRLLPHSELALARAGFTPESSRDFQHGLLRSAVFRRPPS